MVGDVIATDADTVGTLQNWTITGGNADGVFAINPTTGRITVADITQLNFEVNSSYTLTLTVTDGLSTSASQTIHIAVLDQNEAPVFAVAPVLSVNENSVHGTVVGSVSAADQDLADSLTYAISSSSPVSAFAIDAVSGQIRVVNASLLNYETVTSVTLNIRVTDAGGLTDTQIITISINDVNETPTDLVLSGGVVAENSAGGTFVGSVSGSDPDAGDVLRYTLVNNGGGRFVVDATTGTLRVAAGALLNYEAVNTHLVTVRTTDVLGLSYDESFVISVTNVNDAPVATSDTYTALQIQTLNAVSGVLVNDHDEDGQSLTAVLVSGPSHGAIVFNADGTFQYLSTGVFSGTDSFRYQVTDGTLSSNIVTVTIDVLQTLSSGTGAGTGTGSGTGTGTGTGAGAGGSGASSGTTSTSTSSGNSTNSTVPEQVLFPANLNSITAGANSAGSGLRSSDQISEESESGLGTATDSADVLNSIANVLLSQAVFTDEVSVNHAGPERSRSSSVVRTLTTLWSGTSFAADSLDTLISGSVFIFRQVAETHDSEIADEMREMADTIVIGSTAVVSTSFSIGYAIWMLRGGALLTAYMSSIPAWQSFDPLPILQSFGKGEYDDEDEETLLTIVTRKAVEPLLGKGQES